MSCHDLVSLYRCHRCGDLVYLIAGMGRVCLQGCFAIAVALLLALPAVAQEPEPPPRFLPSVWFMADLQAKRLISGGDPGCVIRLWTAGSTVRGGENLFGAMVGMRSFGIGWVWRFKDGGFAFGVGAVAETAALFDEAKPLKIRPAFSLSLRSDKKE